ncbi:uncharacterized protein N7503_002466 [Penicillium pulvis]|uniref:uncharacterized protein n=1 Tax=Penicillium pulvis TaxID=1562058 RepID=UPI00254926B7|nr:uncharacterized protein N7503_002466 [Penicillium pulvis]KAJ5810248.1 hypothetical protein N7503_002466 [Penicillium pulvis]
MHANSNPEVTGGFLHLFSRKERAKRKQLAAQQEQQPYLRVPPAYKADLYEAPTGPRSAHPRPLSSFAPDLSRQSHYYQYPLPRASCDQPPLPTYDPSKYQAIRPNSTPSSDLLANPYAGQSSNLSAAHYHNARNSIYQPAPAPDPYSAPRILRESVAPARRQTAMPNSSRPAASLQQRVRSEARERSRSEPMPAGPDSQGNRRRQKPVLSRLITNFG